MIHFNDEYFMKQALIEAQKALEHNEIPIGAVIVWDNTIIARAFNQTETLQDPTAHAEIIAITQATQKLGYKYLTNATIYVTVEPCVMCIGAIFWAKIKRLVFGAFEPKFGFLKYQNILEQNNLSMLHPKFEMSYGVLADQAAELMKQFFKTKR